jgi:hypothetical protein
MATTTDRAELKAAAAAQRLEAARDKLTPVDENLLEQNGLTSAQVRERVALDLVNRQQTDSSRSLSFCIPAGIVTGAAIIALYLTLTSIGTWNVAQSQTATSVLMSITGLWVLTGLARPLNAWRIAIVAAMYAMCVGVFAIPFIRDFFGFVTLDASQLVIPCAIALGACVLITLVNVVSSRVGTPRETATAR